MASTEAESSTQHPPHEEDYDETTEDTPLLSRDADGAVDEEQGDTPRGRRSSRSGSPDAADSSSSKKKPLLKRWPTILALTVLSIVIVVILVLGFMAPEVIEEYSTQALDFKPTSLSIDSFTKTGVIARIQGEFRMDGSKVHKKSVRDLGRFGTSIVRKVENGPTEVEVVLPEYGNLELGYAKIPPIVVDVRDQHITHVDFLTEVNPGAFQGIRRIASDWIDGKIGELVVRGSADIPLKSGIFSFGTQSFTQSLTFGGDDIPAMPEYDIKKLNVKEVSLPRGDRGLAAEVSVMAKNDWPFNFTIPPLGFSLLVDGCTPSDPHIMLADAITDLVPVKPRSKVTVNATGFVRELPESFLNTCPGSNDSPMDLLVSKYLHGDTSTVYVQAAEAPSTETPQWMSDLLYGVTVPVPFTGHALGQLIKNFTMSDVHFSLPNPFAEPDTPEAQPKVSAVVKALIALPDEMNFPVEVHRIKSNATIFRGKDELGILDLTRWHPASSRPVQSGKSKHSDLEVESAIKDAPLRITNQTTFQEIATGIIMGEKLNLTVKAEVDVELDTALGKFVVHKIPAKGAVPVKPMHGGSLSSFAPKIGNLSITETDPDGLKIRAELNFTNPTKYSATIPYADVNILVNDTILGHATIKDVHIKPGNNTHIAATAVYAPGRESGANGTAIGQEFLSQFISGYNTSVTVRTSRDTIPSQPLLGEALSFLNFTIPSSRLLPRDPSSPHKGPKDGRPHFIQDTVMHILTSTATFTLKSPLSHTTLFITDMDATAFYKNDTVGKIVVSEPDYPEIEVPPGISETPRLPVDWSLGGVGYDAVKKALGGQLKLSAYADVGIRIGEFRTSVWFSGGEIGARVRI